jgi:hypothetical protein
VQGDVRGEVGRRWLDGASGHSIASVGEVRHISARSVGFQTREHLLPAGVVVAR